MNALVSQWSLKNIGNTCFALQPNWKQLYNKQKTANNELQSFKTF